MDITTTRLGNAVFIGGSGRLDSNSSAAFEDRLMKIIDEESAVVLDMSGFNYVSSAGLRVLLSAAKRSKATGHRLALCSLTPEVRMVFDISGFLTLFSIHADRTAAGAAMG